MPAARAGHALLLAFAGLAAWAGTAAPQEPAVERDPSAPTLAIPHLSPVWSSDDGRAGFSGSAAVSATPLDREARFQDFQLDFQREFGTPRGGGTAAPSPEEAFALRLKQRLEERFAESAMLRWYEGAERMARRFEGIYERIEASTSWAGSGFEVHTQMESLVDGRMRVQVEREVRGFRVAFDMRDAAEGRFGLRAGGSVHGYRISVDVSDLAAGTLRLQLDKRFD